MGVAAVRSTPPRSSARDPSAALAAALSDGDLDAAAACFTRDGCLLSSSATTIRGREDIRALLHQLLEMRPDVRVEQRGMLVAGEIALASEIWTIHIDGLEHSRLSQTSTSTSVLRRVEGSWKLQIAAPWGWG